MNPISLFVVLILLLPVAMAIVPSMDSLSADSLISTSRVAQEQPTMMQSQEQPMMQSQGYPAEPAYTPDMNASGYTIPPGSSSAYALPSASKRLFNIATTANPDPVSPGSPTEIKVVVSSRNDNMKVSNAFVYLSVIGGSFGSPCYTRQDVDTAIEETSGYTDSTGSLRAVLYPYPGSTGLSYTDYQISIYVHKQGFTGWYGSFIGKVVLSSAASQPSNSQNNNNQQQYSNGPSQQQELNKIGFHYITNPPTFATDNNNANCDCDENDENCDCTYSRSPSAVNPFVEELNQITDKNEKDEAKSLINDAANYWKQGKFQDAYRCYQSASSYAPNSQTLWYLMGETQAKMGQDEAAKGNTQAAMTHYQYARDDYNKATDVYPQFKEAWIQKAVAYQELKDYSNAFAAQNKASHLLSYLSSGPT